MAASCLLRDSGEKGLKMENTCTFPDCKFWKTFSDNPEECPHFQYGRWVSEDKKIEKQIKECAPISTRLAIMDLYNRMIGIQQAQEQQRNNVDRLANLTCAIVERMAEYPALHAMGVNTRNIKEITENSSE
jgi:hypothetical protein